MSFSVQFTEGAQADLVRLYEFLLAGDGADWALADRAIQTIEIAIRHLENSPFSYRKARPDTPFLRELLIPFGSSGYVALFEIDSSDTVTIVAIRHQREEDYH